MPQTPRTVTDTDRINAYRLRQTGLTYCQVADALGMEPSGVTARNAVFAGARLLGEPEPARRNRAARRAAAQNGPRFGVEIEVVGMHPERAADVLRAAGLSARYERYNHRTRTWWKCTTDASVSGCEVVSPVLAGEDGLRLVRQVIRAIREAGGRVNTTTGLHVHHDMADLNGDQIARVVEFYVGRQSSIDQLVNSDRRDSRNSMLQHMPQHELARWTEQLRSTRRVAAARDDYRRYRTINVCSFPKYGTIEFRQHHGTLDARQVSAWVRFGWAIIEAVKADDDRDIATDVQGMVRELNSTGHLNDTAASNLLARVGA